MEMTGGSTGLCIGEGISLYGSSGKSYWGDRHMFSCILDFFFILCMIVSTLTTWIENKCLSPISVPCWEKQI